MKLIRKLLRRRERGHWVCQTCGEPLDPIGGVIEIVNADPELGTIGGFPHRPRWEAEGADGILLLKTRPRLHFWVYHLKTCDPAPGRVAEGYWIPAGGARTLEAWIAWVVHVSRKSWITRAELMALLEFWWTHKDEQPPAAGGW